MTLSTKGERPPSPIPWPPLLFIAVIVGGRMLDHWLPTPWIPAGPAHLAGTVLIVLGLANDVWCALTLSRHNTTILPHRAVTALVTSGPYRHSRNPIYVSELVMTLGCWPAAALARHSLADSGAVLRADKTGDRARGAAFAREIRGGVRAFSRANAALAVTATRE